MRAVLGATGRHRLAYVFEHLATAELAAGTTERISFRWSLVRDAFYIYYSNRQHLRPKLRVFTAWFSTRNDA